jgi:hypothetical protein
MALRLLNYLQTQHMNKILLGALVCVAVAGVVYYLNNPEKVNDQLSGLKDKASDALGKAKDSLGKKADGVRSMAQQA